MHTILECVAGFLLTAILICYSSLGFAAEYYKWTDDEGNLHISDSVSNVPPKYRNQIENKKLKNDDSESSSVTAPISSPSTLPPVKSEGNPQVLRKPLDRENSDTKALIKYEVPYTPYEGSARRVIISVIINGLVTAPMAIDTGAPGTIISVSLAQKLGLFDEDQGRLVTVAGGIGGTTPAVRSIIDTVQVGGAKIVFVPTTIIKSVSQSFEGLLGMDFVSNYSMTIDTRRSVVVFEELPNESELPGGHDQEWWTSIFKEFAKSRTDWQTHSDELGKKIHDSMTSVGNQDISKKEFADNQCREADKLLDKLNQYAREYNVPMHWRKLN